MRFYDTSSPAERTTALQLALAAAEAGQAVFPLRGKVPAITKRDGGQGYKDATRDRSRVTALFNRAGRGVTGYGVATGRASGIVVLDWDSPEGLAELKRRGMPPTLVVRTVRGGHAYYKTPPGAETKSRDVAPGLELKGAGAYVVGAGSAHPSGETYRVVRDLPIANAPEWLLANGPERKASGRHAGRDDFAGPVSIDTAGEPIPDGERNRTLARIAGRLHDGSRSLDDLTRDLEAINDARCSPPLEAEEVRRIAASIHRRTPCKPTAPKATPRVLAMVDFLQAAAEERPVRGMAGASGWAIYLAGLEACRRFGREHPDGVTLSLDRRTWAQMAGTEDSTVTRWIARSPLVEVIERGSGRRSSTVLFRAPREGVQLHHSTTLGGSLENEPDRSDATGPLLRTLYRSRWSERSQKTLRGVVKGTRMVRQSPKPPPRDGTARMGKSRAALLHAVAECPAGGSPASRGALAARLGRKPDSLKKPLRWLMETGLIVRTSRGHYAPAPDLERRVEDARVLGGEPEADRLQMARHERERSRYRSRDKIRTDRAPTEEELDADPRREHREKRRRVDVLVAHGMRRDFATREVFRAREPGFTSALERIGTDPPSELSRVRDRALSAPPKLPPQNPHDPPAPRGDWREHPIACECLRCSASEPRYATPASLAGASLERGTA